MKREWQHEVTTRAAAYWTEERTRQVLGDKRLPLMPVEAAPLLRALGLLHADASMPPASVRKFMQINHMLVLLEPPLLDLIARFPVVRILDAGCGSSYLTYLLAWCFVHRWHHPAQILGVDRNAQVIAKCQERTTMVDLHSVLRFQTSSLREIVVAELFARAFELEPAADLRAHALVALHACDTATDDALALAVTTGADFVAAAPCCQAELARKWAGLATTQPASAFAPLWTSPHLRREAGATLTDAFRTMLMRSAGYDVTAMEFVPSAHTPKNTLLRAVRRGEPNSAAFAEYRALKAATGGAGIALETLLPQRFTNCEP